MILVQLSIAPVGESTSLHRYVQSVIDILNQEDISYETNAMSTIIEIDNLDHLFSIIKKAHSSIFTQGAQRVIAEIKIDDRRDKEVTIRSKTKSLRL